MKFGNRQEPALEPPVLLPQDFYNRETILVAELLLGKRLVRILPSGKVLKGRIVEVEAYLGVEDPAAHTFEGRRTPRNEAMYLDAGHAYVYFIYGIHHCLNVVTQPRGVPEAVLIRALDPVDGFHDPSPYLLNGPGKLCAALKIDRSLNASAFFKPDSNLVIEDDFLVDPSQIVSGPRVGVSYAGDAAFWPLRFAIRGHAALSPPKFDPET